MATKISKEKNGLILVVFILCGIVIGGLIGELTKGVSWLSWLSYGQSFGIASPFTLNLGIIQLTLGLMIKINIASIVGIIIAIIIHRKL